MTLPVYLDPETTAEYVGQHTQTSTALIEQLIRTVSRDADQYCARHFYQAGTDAEPETRYFDTPDQRTLRLGAFNDLVSVDAIHVDTAADGSFGDELTSYQLHDQNAATREWPYTQITTTQWPAPRLDRVGLIRVSGVWGWPEVPAPVVEACLLMVARLAARKVSPVGLAGGGDFGQMRVFGDGWDQDADARLAPYRLTPVICA